MAPAPEIFKDQHTFEDGTRYVAKVYDVRGDPNYPSDVKIRFQYYDPKLERENKTILRYDNCHEREGYKYHKHKFVGDKEVIEDINFEGDIESLYNQFLREVDEYREQR